MKYTHFSPLKLTQYLLLFKWKVYKYRSSNFYDENIYTRIDTSNLKDRN